jgi:hypothetical protein
LEEDSPQLFAKSAELTLKREQENSPNKSAKKLLKLLKNLLITIFQNGF